MTDLLRGELMDALFTVKRYGQDVIITRYGKPIARICPIEPPKTATDPASWLSLDPQAKPSP